MVVGGDAYFDVAEFSGLGLDDLGYIFAGGVSRRLLVAGQAGGHDQRAVQVVMLFPDLTHLYVGISDGIGPVTRSPFCDVHGFQRILAGVPVNLTVLQGDTRNRF